MHAVLYYIFLVYFITHIPISLLFDLQAILGSHYPESLQGLNTFYCNAYNDPLICGNPIWFKSMIWLELILQIPFFFYACYGLLYKDNNIRIPSIMYGAHVSTTLWPILAEFLYATSLTTTQRLTLFSFYLPYLIIPFTLMIYMAFTPMPFPKKVKGK